MVRLKRNIRQRSGESGASAVEFAVIAVVLFTIVGLIAQGGFLFAGWLAVTNGAREGARYAAACINREVLGCTDDDVKAVVRDRTRGFLDQDPAHFGVVVTHTVSAQGPSGWVFGDVHVSVTATVPSVGPLLGDLPLSGRSVMRSEY